MRDGSADTYIEDIVKHMVHIKNKAGIEALAFGSDFDGITSNLEFKDYTGMPTIVKAMEKHFTPREIDMICNENALRVIKASMK